MTIKLSTGLRNAMAGTTGFAGALANGIIEVYSGSQPATADSPTTGTLLGVVTTGGLAFTPGSATNGLTWATATGGGVSKSTSAWQFTGLAAGTAGWFRIKGNALDDNLTSAVLPRMDGSIASSGGDMSLSNISVAAGAPNTVDVCQFNIPAQ